MPHLPAQGEVGHSVPGWCLTETNRQRDPHGCGSQELLRAEHVKQGWGGGKGVWEADITGWGTGWT